MCCCSEVTGGRAWQREFAEWHFGCNECQGSRWHKFSFTNFYDWSVGVRYGEVSSAVNSLV